MKKGFTLIELLAVIVILAVLALIATPIVLNIIDDSKKNATLRSSENYIKAVEFSIAKSVMENKKLSDGTYNLMSNGNICLGTLTGDTCDNELIVEVSGETPESGTITIKSRKIDSYEFTYASGFVVLNGEINSEDAKVCELTLDEDGDGVADIGDMITCSTESFHVIENDGTTISMLAQYNLDVGYVCDYESLECEEITNSTGIQNENTIGYKEGLTTIYGSVSFSSTNYWYEASSDEYLVDVNFEQEGRELPFVYGDYSENNLYPYVEAYEEYLIGEGVMSAEGTLISYEQLRDLGCVFDDNCPVKYNWIYATDYWTGSGGSSDDIHFMGTGYYFLYLEDYSVYENHGVRPVINISVNEL